MAKSPKKKPTARPDFAQTAFRVVQEATGQAPKTPAPDAKRKTASKARKGMAKKRAPAAKQAGRRRPAG